MLFWMLPGKEEVTFFDTAEMYPIPPKAETHNRTEEISWKMGQISYGKRKDRHGRQSDRP